MPNFISEDQIERAMVRKLVQLHAFEALNCHTEDPEDLNDRSGRSNKRDVVLVDRMMEAAARMNPAIPTQAIAGAMEAFLDRRQAMTLVAANQEIYNLLRDGVPVEFDNAEGQLQKERVRFVDFNAPSENRFLAVTQLWIKGERGFRRPDLLLYVNGIPLVFIELKNSNVKLKTAFDDNLTNYKREIPQLFLTNVLCILSNAVETKVGSITAEWEHFFNWLRAEDEKEKIDREAIKEKGTSLEGVIAGLLPPHRLLDYVENFVLYYRDKDKIIAQNHQFIGVNRAYDKFLHREELKGRLGVFWHTQGSGKSFSMIFYARKIYRKQTGDFTFVVVTDRNDLDGQIYRNFLHTNTVTKAEAAQPKNSEEMRKFLGQHKRLVFTLIQKFRWEKGKDYPLLSPRSDIIVMVDEAHRTQYKDLAENMRAGLKNAQFIAFTGTPLLGRERKTNKWFGDYVSEYNFQQSMDDGATVPLFYKKRVPQVLIQNDDLADELAEICEDENLDDAQRVKLENRFAQEIEVIKRDDRLDTIAADIVYHFPKRGYLGKGMVVSLDKFTAVKMYDKVQLQWKNAIKELRGQIKNSVSEDEKKRLQKQLDYMRSVEMAVVVSEEADEEKKFAKQKLAIKPHRDRMNKVDEHGHDIEYNFKDPENPLQLVFVCAMWLTGFDAPTLSTLYLDKPMKDHTLMQTIARANRVTSFKIDGKEKKNGEIIDYYNVFRNMRKALKDYAQGQEGQENMPVEKKEELFKLLDDAIAQGSAFCSGIGADIKVLLENKDVFKNVGTFEDYANVMLGNEEWRKGFAVYENTITGLYEACKPEILGQPVVRTVAVFQYLRGVLDAIIEQTDIDAVALRVGELLDESLIVEKPESSKDETGKYRIAQSGKTWDLSKIDFEKLKEDFKTTTHKNIEIADLRAFIQKKLDQMLKENAGRTDFATRLQGIIDRYNAGSSTADNYFNELMAFTKDLQAESERHIVEGLSEEELELFDLIKKDKMTKDETQKVRLAAKSLLHRLREEQPKVLIQDWFKDGQSRTRVRSAVEAVLDDKLPDTYDRAVFTEKCNNVFETMVIYANQGVKWAVAA
ncbi:MAG: type I restriction endonuclease subunit R [Bryobacteraceae bacterium]